MSSFQIENQAKVIDMSVYGIAIPKAEINISLEHITTALFLKTLINSRFLFMLRQEGQVLDLWTLIFLKKSSMPKRKFAIQATFSLPGPIQKKPHNLKKT